MGLQVACIKKADPTLDPVPGSRPLLTILKNNYNFSLFYSALQRSGLDKTLEGTGPFTLLVPDNDAFALSGINADSLSRIDLATLQKLVSYHIIGASISYSSVPQTVGFGYKTLAGPQVYFSVPIPGPKQLQLQANVLHINGVTVNKVDIAASNGYIMDLSKVLYYPAASVKSFLESSPQYSYFTQALKQFGLLNQLDGPGPFVVMAPNNDVFIKHRINQAAIAAMDTLTYKKFLFSANILSPQRFFASDFYDAPLPSTMPVYVSTDLLLLFTTKSLNSLTYGAVPYNYLSLRLPYIYGEQVSFSDPNHQALNGVVHGISGLPVLAANAKAK
eukprot:gene2880-3306_t